MRAPRFLFVLAIAILGLLAAIVAGDLGAGAIASREVLTLALLAVAGLAVQAWLAWRAEGTKPVPVLFVRDGSVQRSSGHERARPISLAVESGQAVVLERDGLFSRILGPGLGALSSGETVYKVVSTAPRPMVGTVACSTRDGIPVTIDFEITGQVMLRPGQGSDRSKSPTDYASPPAAAPRQAEPRWSDDALVRAAYETHSWETAVLALARSSLREQFARAYLADLSLPAVSPQGTTSLESLQSRCGRRIASSGSLLGISIQGFQITHFGLPPELAADSLPARRMPRPGEKPRFDRPDDADTSARRWTTIRLASVLGGGPFVTLRQALRGRVGEVTIPDVLLEGRRWTGRAVSESDPVPYELHPDRVHFDVQVHGRSFRPAGICEDDHLLFASLPDPSDGDIVAVLLDGRLELRRFWQKADHALLEPERNSQPPVALVGSDELAGGLRARYAGSEPAVEVRSAAAVKVLGRAAIAFRPQPVARRAAAEPAISKQQPLLDQEPEPPDALAEAPSEMPSDCSAGAAG